jgi:chromosome segregation ATPase
MGEINVGKGSLIHRVGEIERKLWEIQENTSAVPIPGESDFEIDLNEIRDKLESSGKKIGDLEDAKTNILGRVSQTEKTVFELDSRFKQTQSSLEKLQVLKDSYSEFEDLISESVSEIDRIKSVLSGMENKIDGDLAHKVSSVESLLGQQQEDVDRKIEQVEKKINLVVDKKLKTIDSFSKEIDALKEGKSLVYDKFSLFSNNIDSINLTLSDLKDRLRKLDPKVSSLENTIQGDISPAVTSIRFKISEMDALKTGLEFLKNKISKSSQGKFTDRVEILDKQIRQIRRDVYGGDQVEKTPFSEVKRKRKSSKMGVPRSFGLEGSKKKQRILSLLKKMHKND